MWSAQMAINLTMNSLKENITKFINENIINIIENSASQGKSKINLIIKNFTLNEVEEFKRILKDEQFQVKFMNIDDGEYLVTIEWK